MRLPYIKTLQLMKNKVSIKQHLIPVVFSITAGFFIPACSSEYSTTEKVELTKGLITEVKEIEADKFKIIDERVVENKADSRVIAHYLDGTRDTLTLDQASVTKTQDDTKRSHVARTARMGIMGFYFGRSFGVGPNSSAYANQSVYNRSNTSTRSTLSKTAKRTTIRKPVRSSRTRTRSTRSTRSFGG